MLINDLIVRVSNKLPTAILTFIFRFFIVNSATFNNMVRTTTRAVRSRSNPNY
jgi:hypothetical protein